MKRSASADRAAPRTPVILPFNNVKPARPTLVRASSLGREVRCGCQFFGTDSLLPERRTMMLAGRPLGYVPTVGTTQSSPSGSCNFRSPVPNRTGTLRREAIITSAACRTYSSEAGDHEYETVSPRNPPALLISAPYDRYEPELGMAPHHDEAKENFERVKRERKFFHDNSLEDEMSYMRPGMQREPHDFEDGGVLDDNDNREVVAPSPCSTGSRTDMDLNSSQVNSSALEDLPLSRDARRKLKLEKAEERGPSAAARSLQSIRNQAGQLRAKMRSMKRPKINLPDRPKFNFPERPKFNLPERPKFNLPDRPKIKLPDRPKFNLPERPKFKMPERPKLNFNIDKSKFSLPDRSKFNFTLPKSHRIFRERNQQQGTSEDAPVHIATPMVDTPSKRSYFNFRTYPRLFDRKNQNRAAYRPRQITPPVMKYTDDMDDEMEDPIKPHLPPRRKASRESNENWANRFNELDYVDDDSIRLRRQNGSAAPFDDEEDDLELLQLKRELRKQHSGDSELEISESLSGFRDKDFGYALTFSTGGHQQLISHMDSLQRGKAPKMEEEDMGSDQEVAHSSGSSSDRRRAGVLEEISSDEFFLREKGISHEDVNVERMISQEIKETFSAPPDNTSESMFMTEAELARSYRGTPERVSPSHKARPPRKSPRTPRQLSKPNTPPPEMQQIGTTSEAPKGDTSLYFNTFPPNKPSRNRRRQLKQKAQKGATTNTTPRAPQRKSKSTRSELQYDSNSQWSVEQDQDWLKNIESRLKSKQVDAQQNEPDYEIAEVDTPSVPKRGRKNSAQSRKTEDDARSYISYISRASDMQEDPGYAYVIKPGVISYEQPPLATPPPRRAKNLKGQYPTASRRRRGRPLSGTGVNNNQHFFTMPHRKVPPVRPQRNYATLGPARPPRRARRASCEDVRSESLQSGAVIQKMKERPLPPPPRPPRKEKGQDEEFEAMDIETAIPMEGAPLAATENSEDEKTIQSEIRPEVVKEPSPLEEQVLIHANLTVSNAEVVVTQEKTHESAKAPAQPTSESASSESAGTCESVIEKASSVSVQPLEKKSEVVEVAATVASEPKPTLSEPQRSVQAQPSTEPEVAKESVIPMYANISAPAESNILTYVEPIQEVIQPVVSVTNIQTSAPVPVESTVQTKTETASFAQPPQVPDPVPIERVEAKKFVSTEQPSEVKPSVAVVQKESIVEKPQRPSILKQAPVQEFAIQPPTDVSYATQIGETQTAAVEIVEEIPVEQFTISTQTDPLPDDEQINDVIPIETKYTERHEPQQAPAPPPAPAPAPVIDTEALVAALTSQILASAMPALHEAMHPSQLRVDLLDVGSLKVSDLQAQRMFVPNIEGMALAIQDLQSQTGRLALNAIEGPMDNFSEALIAAMRSLIPATPPQIEPPVRQIPPAPSQSSEPQATQENVTPNLAENQAAGTSSEETGRSGAENLRTTTPAPQLPSGSASQIPLFTTEQVLALQMAALRNMAPSGTRERSCTPTLSLRRQDFDEQSPPPPQPTYYLRQHADVDPGIIELGNRLARACCCATLSALRRVVSYTEHHSNSLADETRERSGLQIALCVVLVICAGIIIVASMGGNSSSMHQHHWDFYMPQ